jgi:hypothetical protein
MPNLDFYLGPAGGLVAIRPPGRDIDKARPKRVGTHELLSGGNVVDRVGGRRRYTLSWEALTADELATLEALYELPGPLVLYDPGRRNMLTANQSMGTDALRSAEGFSARTQGTVSSSTAQFRSWSRACAWATGSALGSTDRGIVVATSSATVDGTWTPVLPSTQYTISGYLRTTAAVSMKAGWEWYNAAGILQGAAVFGSGVALSTSNFATRVTHTATSHASAAYGVPLFLNTTTTGAAITVYLDEIQMEEAAAASAYVVGTGVPRVSLVDLPNTSPLTPWENAELVIQEL